MVSFSGCRGSSRSESLVRFLSIALKPSISTVNTWKYEPRSYLGRFDALDSVDNRLRCLFIRNDVRQRFSVQCAQSLFGIMTIVSTYTILAQSWLKSSVRGILTIWQQVPLQLAYRHLGERAT